MKENITPPSLCISELLTVKQNEHIATYYWKKEWRQNQWIYDSLSIRIIESLHIMINIIRHEFFSTVHLTKGMIGLTCMCFSLLYKKGRRKECVFLTSNLVDLLVDQLLAFFYFSKSFIQSWLHTTVFFFNFFFPVHKIFLHVFFRSMVVSRQGRAGLW